MDVLSVDGEAISFCFLVFLLTVRPLCGTTAGGPLQTLLAWESPMGTVEQQVLLPDPSSGSFVPEGYPPDVSQSSPVLGVSLDIWGSGSCLRRQPVPYQTSSAKFRAP